jgi:ribosomal protein S27E
LDGTTQPQQHHHLEFAEIPTARVSRRPPPHNCRVSTPRCSGCAWLHELNSLPPEPAVCCTRRVAPYREGIMKNRLGLAAVIFGIAGVVFLVAHVTTASKHGVVYCDDRPMQHGDRCLVYHRGWHAYETYDELSKGQKEFGHYALLAGITLLVVSGILVTLSMVLRRRQSANRPDDPPPSREVRKVKCCQCQHIQAVPTSQQSFACEKCGKRLKRRAVAAQGG